MNESHYAITVTIAKRHFFTTQIVDKEKARLVFNSLCARYPEKDHCKVTCSNGSMHGKQVLSVDLTHP